MKGKDQFQLNPSLLKLVQAERNQSNTFLKQLLTNEDVDQKKQITSKYKLNPSLQIDIVEQQRIIKDIQQQKQIPQEIVKVNETNKFKRPQKHYSTDIFSLYKQVKEDKIETPQKMIEQEETGELKPSQPYMGSTASYDLKTPTIFQTPLLPCLASQFQSKAHNQENKNVREKKGVWKIGKIILKDDKYSLKIADFQFEGSFVPSEGKCAVIKQRQYNQLPNWNGIWVMQPKDDLFT